MKLHLVIIECAGYFSGSSFCSECNPLETATPKLWTFLLLLFTIIIIRFLSISYFQKLFSNKRCLFIESMYISKHLNNEALVLQRN